MSCLAEWKARPPEETTSRNDSAGVKRIKCIKKKKKHKNYDESY